MATATTPSPTRADIFRTGLKDATGTIIYWRGTWGTIQYDGPVPIEYFVPIEAFPAGEREDVRENLRVVFDVGAGQADMKSMNLPAGTKLRKARVSSARLMNYTR